MLRARTVHTDTFPPVTLTLTSIYDEHDLDILKTYLQTEIEVSRSRLSEVRAQTG